MNVEEYLRTLNGIFENEELTPDKIRMFGFIDIVPDLEDYTQSQVESVIIDSGNIIVKRTFKTKQGNVSLEKITPLSDNIAIHCGKNNTAEQVIDETIDGLQEMQESGLLYAKVTDKQLIDYQPRINAFINISNNIKQVNSNSSSKTVRK